MPSLGNHKDKFYAEYVEKLPSLEGKVVAITGTTSGTGYWAAVLAIRKGAKALLLLNRESSRSKASLEKLEEEKKQATSGTEIIPVTCDLMSFESVREAAGKINELCKDLGGLNVLANNAGIGTYPDNRTKDGYDIQMQTNHLSHYLLMKLVLPSAKIALDAGEEVRFCQHSSGARDWGPLEAKYFDKSDEGKLGGNALSAKAKRYAQTKLANACFAMMLHKKLSEEGYDTTKFKSVLAEPGASATGLLDNISSTGDGSKSFMGRIAINLTIFYYKRVTGAQSAADGSLPLAVACFGSDVESGDFFYPEKKTTGRPYKAVSKGSLVKGNRKKEKLVLDEKLQNLVWDKSEEALGSFFAVEP